MDSQAELAGLQKRVAALENELLQLRQFIAVENSPNPARKRLQIRCTELHLCSPEMGDEVQCALIATKEGPVLAMYAEGESRLALRVADGQPSLSLFTRGPSLAAQIGLDDNGRSFIGVLDDGRPRAVMKSTAAGGVITVSHDDGQPRAFLRSEFTVGELFIVNADMKTVVKLSSAGPHGEGFVSVNYANGRPAAVISAAQQCGAVIVNDPAGRAVGTLPAETTEEEE